MATPTRKLRPLELTAVKIAGEVAALVASGVVTGAADSETGETVLGDAP